MDVTTSSEAAYPGQTESAEPEQTEQAEAPASILQHAEQFKPGSVRDVADRPVEGEQADAPKEGETAERGPDGKFVKVKHRAKSQQATPEDVEAINGYTKRIKEYEARVGADIVQKPGESQRVYEMRRRAELLERQQKPAERPAPRVETRPEPRPEPAKAPEDQKPVDSDPKYADDYGLYLEDRAAWAAREEWRKLRAHEAETAKAAKLAEDHEKAQKSWIERVSAAKTKYPDFEAVAFAPTRIPTGSLMDAWIMEHKAGADVLYSLQQHPGEVERILSLPLLDQVEELALLAQRLTPPRQAAVNSGAAPAPRLVNLPPRPPTPERTEAQRATDGPPPTDGSLSVLKHAKAFLKR